MNYSSSEMMIVASARELKDARIAFVGVGLPNVACNLAQRAHNPRLELVYEAGVFGARPARLPLSIGDPTLVTNATSVCSMSDLFQFYLQRGLIDVGFLGVAQIDKFGNINTTVIGEYAHPKTRLPGSGGAAEIANLCERVLVITRMEKRTFVERVDFITSAGFLDGGDAREQLHIRGRGPQAVVTDLGILRFDSQTKEMYLASVHPNVTVDAVKANVGWELKIAADLQTTPAPTETELRILRAELDPQGTFAK